MAYHDLQAPLLPTNTKRSPIKHIFSVKGGRILRHPQNTSNVFPFNKSSNNFSTLTTDPLFSFVLDRYKKEECEIRGKFFNGLHFFSKALREDDDILKFLSFVFAIEAICSVSDTKIIEGLANFVSNINMSSSAAKHMKAIYKIRSKIVHHGQTFVARSDIKLAQVLAQSAIYKAMHIYNELAQKSDSVKQKDWKEAIRIGIA